VLQCEHGIAADQVNNGVDCRRFSPRETPADRELALRLGLDFRGPVFLAVGGIEERKNTLRILLAFNQVKRDLPDAQLVIAGGASLLDHDQYRRDFFQALAASGLSSGPGASVVLSGPVPDADMPALFRLADALLMPSLREGFGLVVLEALASGTPVVVSNMAPFTEYLRDGECFWANPADADSIGAAMRLAVAPTPARARALAAAPQVCRRFDWAASAARHAGLYRATLAQPVCA
jgi:glycosyltransferase-like protein